MLGAEGAVFTSPIVVVVRARILRVQEFIDTNAEIFRRIPTGDDYLRAEHIFVPTCMPFLQ